MRTVPSVAIVAAASALACAMAGAACEPPPPDPVPVAPAPLETPYSVEPSACDIGPVAVGTFATCTLLVTNVSDVEVALTAATSGPPFLVVVVGGFQSLLPGESATVNVNAVPRDVGVVTGELAFGPGRLVVPLSVEGLPPPDIEVTVTPDDVVEGSRITLSATADAPGTFAFAITEQPDGAEAALLPEDAASVSLDVGVAGTYIIAVTLTADDGATATENVVIDARAKRDVALTTSAGVLHVRPVDEALCGPLDCFAGACTALDWGGGASPVAAGGGVVVEDLPLGSFRASLVLPADATATDATLSVFSGGALLDEVAASLTPGDAVDVLDLVVTPESGVAIEEVGVVVAGGACP